MLSLVLLLLGLRIPFLPFALLALSALSALLLLLCLLALLAGALLLTSQLFLGVGVTLTIGILLLGLEILILVLVLIKFGHDLGGGLLLHDDLDLPGPEVLNQAVELAPLYSHELN